MDITFVLRSLFFIDRKLEFNLPAG